MARTSSARSRAISRVGCALTPSGGPPRSDACAALRASAPGLGWSFLPTHDYLQTIG